MRKNVSELFNNLPIHRKFFLASAIPLTALLLLSVVTYRSVQTVSQDEEQLDSLYVIQKTSAQYMRLVVDLETGFRGYILTEQVRYLRPYRVAQEGIFPVGRNLEQMVSGEQQQQLQQVQLLVKQLLTEKEDLIRAVQAGRKQKALEYIEEGRGRALMVGIRERMSHFDHLEQQRVSDTLAQLSRDRTSRLFVILGWGVITFGLIVCALYLISRSIAVPLVNLARIVGSSPAGAVPAIAVLERNDEIGDLTRVMHAMSSEIRGHLSELEKSEAALRQLNQHLASSEAKYRGLVDHAPFGIFTTQGTEVTFSNRYNQVLAGFDPDEEVDDPAGFRHRIHPEDQDRVLSEFSQAVAESRPCETVFRFLHPDGGVRKILSRRLPITNRDGVPPIYVGFNIDITALDDLQSRLSRAEHLATLGQVAAGIAHELRNPLVGIGSTASLLLDEFADSDPRRTDVAVILTETRRLDRIVNQIVEYAKPRDLAPIRFAISDLVDEVAKVFDVPLQAKHLAIRASLSPNVDHLHADRDQIKQVLLNVIHNAIDATPMDGSAIEITAFELSNHERPGIVVNVRDAGVGISSEALSHVFEPFFTTGKRHGTGLGLAICRNIVESHSGDIYMTSEIGKGTTVRIWLPLNQEIQLAKG